MTKHILILEGSPRKNGNSCTLAEQAAKGVRADGGEPDVVFLQGLKIAPCTSCDACRKNGICTIKDDTQTLYPKLAEADGLILASPIFWFTYSAQLKTCIDRWYSLWNGKHDFLKGKPVGVILTYGDTDLFTSDGINAIHTLDTMFDFLGAKVDWVYGSLMDIGDAEKDPELMAGALALGKKIV